MKTATIFDIERNSYVDGPGIRTTVFFKGCNLRCAWCHNPESQSPKPQMMFYKNKCTGCGKCREKCPNSMEKCDLCGKCTVYCPHDAREICGREYTVDEQLIKNDDNFEKTVDMLLTYFKNGGVHFQLTYVSKEDLICAKESPDNYKHLRVRVSGFSDYFVKLNEAIQDDIIARTEQR